MFSKTHFWLTFPWNRPAWVADVNITTCPIAWTHAMNVYETMFVAWERCLDRCNTSPRTGCHLVGDASSPSLSHDHPPHLAVESESMSHSLKFWVPGKEVLMGVKDLESGTNFISELKNVEVFIKFMMYGIEYIFIIEIVLYHTHLTNVPLDVRHNRRLCNWKIIYNKWLTHVLKIGEHWRTIYLASVISS